jgi:hypothetical protein
MMTFVWVYLLLGLMFYFCTISELGWSTAKSWNPPKTLEDYTWRYRILIVLPICLLAGPILWVMLIVSYIGDAIRYFKTKRLINDRQD